MWNPFKKAKKAVDTKLKKAALTATLLAVLTGVALRLDVQVAKEALEELAAAISEVALQVIDSPKNPPAGEGTNDE